jgi:transcriptional regulator with XRE-family HTH domain
MLAGMTTAPVGTAPLRERVAEELRALLARRKVTPTELGRKLGRSQTWVWRRLEGEVAFDLNDLEVIADALSVAVADLFPPDVRQAVRTIQGNSQVADRPTDNRPPARPKGRGDRPVSTAPGTRRTRLIGSFHSMATPGATA